MKRNQLLVLSASDSDADFLEVPLCTLIVLYSFSICGIDDIQVVLVDAAQSQHDKQRSFTVPYDILQKLNCTVMDKEVIPKPLSDCKPPAVYLADKITCIGGLAGVLRWALSHRVTRTADPFCKALLGFRGGSLAACSESSLWTNFCEIDIYTAVFKLRDLKVLEEPRVQLPEELLLLEAHLRQPVKTHNIRRRQQQVLKDARRAALSPDSNKCPNPKTLPELEHRYVEGFDRTLADVILFPCVHICLTELRSRVSHDELVSALPLTVKWYERVAADERSKRALDALGLAPLSSVQQKQRMAIEEAELPRDSLYSTHPDRTRPRIRHKDPAHIVQRLEKAGVVPNLQPNPGSDSLPLPWHTYPSLVHPSGGGLPSDRASRKCQQIENLVVLALRRTFDGCTVVDFCSGGGHVGIVIAYLRPDCRVVMIENKEESMRRARDRILALGLCNVTLYQCNMDYYVGDFDVGVSLHACGVATDLVLRKCIQRRAAFVSCPCCYGAMKGMAEVSYPLSRVFREAGMSEEDYVLLCHYADRTERDTPTCQQGHHCMGLVDRDRASSAEEFGYSVVLTRMCPADCSPKGLVLLGTWDKAK
ncbi:glutathione S-transferase C-terminal domain-containing protein [Ixodes scapularis]|uniref:glutathione S-transferase C-terminal domain-containing protein n=1 Tax=Ixodes scapularis TaxID=6945 RepID=UPI001A9D7B26|nr:glutathione S-transferase C-terminal domain-containing protein [Ixodes scapularis]